MLAAVGGAGAAQGRAAYAWRSEMLGVLDKSLVWVTGKGGVGKTTVALALGLRAARAGRRVIVCEVAAQERVARVLDRSGSGFAEEEIAPGLWGISVAPERALEEYLRVRLGSSAPARMLWDNRLFGYVAAATPGLRELVTVGKVWDLAQRERHTEGGLYDLVVVDAPATGHALALLRAPRTFRDLARAGPIYGQAGRIDAFLRDPERTGVVCVCLAEEMPVTETLELRERLSAEAGMEVDEVVVNALLPERLTAEEAARLAGGAPAHPAALAALEEHRRARRQRERVALLEEDLGAAVVSLPFVFSPELGTPELEALSRRLP